MKSIKVKTNTPYGVIIGEKTIEVISQIVCGKSKIVLLSTEKVFSVFGEKITKIIERGNLNLFTKIVLDGEQAKSFKKLEDVLDFFAKINLTKKDLVLSLGGGTALDLFGLACSIYKRGVPYVNIPTTLLAMADAGIGGKTAVNYNGIKNLLGVINQPVAVIIDTEFISTLKQEDILNGYAEIIKSAIVGDKKLFALLEGKKGNITDYIYRALKVKAKLVAMDESDLGVRRLLNLGHTVGHAVESASNYTVPHGEAVSMGLVSSAVVSKNLGHVDNVKKIENLLSLYGLPVSIPLILGDVSMFLYQDKKTEYDKINFVTIEKIGKCKIEKISVEKIRKCLSGH